jgi:DNA-binding response OmpR family regulator
MTITRSATGLTPARTASETKARSELLEAKRSDDLAATQEQIHHCSMTRPRRLDEDQPRERVMTARSIRAGNHGMLDLRSRRLRPARVLVVDADVATGERLRALLDTHGHLVRVTDGPAAARALLLRHHFDLIVTGLRFEDGSGFDVLDAAGETPVVVLAACDELQVRLRAFRLGADDFVVPPFEPSELAARVAAVLRRASGVPTREVVTFDLLEIDVAARQISVAGTVVETTAMEFDLLAFLGASPGRVFSRHQLLTAVWGSSSAWQQSATVTEHVRRVRQKLVAAGATDCIETVRGVGYRFTRRTAPAELPAPVIDLEAIAG